MKKTITILLIIFLFAAGFFYLAKNNSKYSLNFNFLNYIAGLRFFLAGGSQDTGSIMTDPNDPESYIGNGNLIVNPGFYWQDQSTIGLPLDKQKPVGWTKYYENPKAGLTTSWVGDDPNNPENPPRHLKSEVNYQATETPQWNLGWYQNVYINPESGDKFSEKDIYEITARVKIEDRGFNFNKDGTIVSSSNESAGGVYLGGENASGKPVDSKGIGPRIFIYDAAFTDWSNQDGCYHNVGKYTSGWQTYKVYIKPHPDTKYIRVRAIAFSPGKVWFDYIKMKKVERDFNTPLFKKSGSIKFVKNSQNQLVFLIGIVGDTPTLEDGSKMSYNQLKQAGFNATTALRLKEMADSGLYGMGYTGTIPYLRDELSNPADPNSSRVIGFKLGISKYVGLQSAIERVKNLIKPEGPEILLFSGVDESNYRISTNGAPPELRELNYIKQQIKTTAGKNIPYMLNVMPQDWDLANNEPHAKLADIISFTWNTPLSYTNSKAAAYMGRAGEFVRKWLDVTAKVNGGEPKPVIAFGLGVYYWSQWDFSDNYNHKNQIIPFHLQRFQVYNQLANGAGGVYFWGGKMNFAQDTYSKENWNQIKELSAEINSLYNVYLEPNFYDEWSADKYIEAMLKKYNGKLYLISTNPSEFSLGNVKITISGNKKIAKIKALFENANTILENPLPWPSYGVGDSSSYNEENRNAIRKRGITNIDFFGRDIAINSDKTSFTDKFIDYATHIYEIEFEQEVLPPPPSPNLSVLLSASPNSGQSFLNNVSLTANVSGNSNGNINYTFYCNRQDSGINITSPYDAKFNDISEMSKTVYALCNYSLSGNYTAKVIVERGSFQAESRTTIVVSSSQPVNPEPKTPLKFPVLTGPFYIGLMNSEEVKNLQRMLSQDSDIYPEKAITGNYDNSTTEAVKRFQIKYNIIKQGFLAYGLAGPKTRIKLNELYAQSLQAPTDKKLLIERLKLQIKAIQEKLVQLMQELIKALEQEKK